jgi:coenzyme F420-reducing hydrogenase alpha subunit
VSGVTRPWDLIEAPRGTLFHHYKVNENDQV